MRASCEVVQKLNNHLLSAKTAKGNTMKLVGFSVTNFRSITKAHKLPISDSTILVGQNNEGKSNILHALATAMQLIRHHAMGRIRRVVSPRYQGRGIYDWEKDFPIQLQARKPNGKSIFRLEFELTEDEILEFRTEIKSNLNGTLAIEVQIGEEYAPEFKVLKRGPGGTALSNKATKIAHFIGNRINLTYIPAIRTSGAAVRVVEEMLEKELSVLEDDPTYQAALEQISKLQEPILKNISDKITDPLKQFIPQIKDVTVSISQEKRYRALRGSCEVIIDDGIPTSIERKGDGVKSLAAISLLRGASERGRASILALEEPESHLHPSAIHRLRNVIEELSQDHQVVITTHCPLFVDRNKISTNIIISANTAKPAKKISEVRDILGVKAADNLLHARMVLIVEGKEDKISLEAIFKHFSPTISKAIKDGNLFIDPSDGAGNLSYKLSNYQAAVCLTHVFFDNDDAGRTAIQKAEADEMVKVSDYHLTICNGMTNAEFEDCIDVKTYKNKIEDEFGVDLAKRTFRNNNKWSDRMRETFLSQGKPWNDQIEKQVKYVVANCVQSNPENALNEHKRSSIDALVSAIEGRIEISGA
jgi:AAA15 family ATPase/GTPase